MCRFLDGFVGPRVPAELLRQHRCRFVSPSLIFMAARLALLVSIFLPYWHMELEAPQYPDGLYLTAYVNHLQGDVKEINGLNHYIGMKPLEQAASLERTLSIWLVIAMFLMVEGAAFIHSKWAVPLALPAIGFPAGFLADLRFWLIKFGQDLDPNAPLSSSVKPFTPAILGEGGIGQFKTYAEVGIGFWFAVACAALMIVGFFFHRRAYRPLTLASRDHTIGNLI